MKHNRCLMRIIIPAIVLAAAVQLLADAATWTFVAIAPRATASSTMKDNALPQNFYAPQKAVDGDLSTAWCTNRNGGVGESLEIRYPRDQVRTLGGVYIMNGVGRSEYLYYANNRVKDYELTLTFENRKTKVERKQTKQGTMEDCLCLNEDRKPDRAAVPGAAEFAAMAKNQKKCKEPFMSMGIPPYSLIWASIPDGEALTSVKLTVNSVYPGLKYNETCISEMKLASTHYDKGNP